MKRGFLMIIHIYAKVSNYSYLEDYGEYCVQNYHNYRCFCVIPFI